ncbi:PIN domain-containing protein [Candidatus Woesearchaeota archaeon]|nr:PIN domain-containing protein [Candidatus Woesearchaeota archaeon]
MGEIETFFFDSYAFFEILKENPNYKKYNHLGIITTRLNLMELHYGLLRFLGEKVAEEAYENFNIYTIEINDLVIKEANKFKLSHRKRKLSYVDCVGYIFAKMVGVKFLTGDKQFEDLDNVEFVR